MPGLPIATVATLTNLAPPAPPPGIVATGAATVLAMSLPVARIGDHISPHGKPSVCPICQNSESNVIMTGIPNILVEGQPLAVATSVCACGHVLTPENTAGIPPTVFAGGAVG